MDYKGNSPSPITQLIFLSPDVTVAMLRGREKTMRLGEVGTSYIRKGHLRTPLGFHPPHQGNLL